MWKRHIQALAAALVLAGIASSLSVKAQTPPPLPAASGAWWGIARPCTSGSRFPVPAGTVNQSICKEACGGATCPASTFPVDEVAMSPTLLPDGTVIATDHLSLVDHHTTSQGKWEASGKTVIDGKSYDRIQASFMWFQPRNPTDADPRFPLSIFLGMIRPRFVMFFDAAEPNIMRGYIQPYVFSLTDGFGIINLQPNTPFPANDPMLTLPTTCDPRVKSTPYCAGTLMFVIRRIPAK